MLILDLFVQDRDARGDVISLEKSLSGQDSELLAVEN
jgi:hypothetical protein